MFLSSAQIHPALTQKRVDALFKTLNVFQHASILGRLNHFRPSRIDLKVAKRDVVANGVAEQKDVLRDIAKAAAHGRQVPLRQGRAVKQNCAFLGVHHPHEELQHRRFSASRSAGDAQGLARLNLKAEVVQCQDARFRIGPRHLVKGQFGCLRQGIRSRQFPRRLHRGLGVQERENPGHGCLGFLDEGRHPSHRREGPRQEIHVKDKLKDVSEVKVPGFHAMSTHVHGENGAESHQQHNQRHEHGFDLHQVEHAHFVHVCFHIKPLCGRVFAVEAFQHAHPGNVLLDKTRHGTLGLLLGVALPVDVGGDEINPHRHQRQGEKREGRQHRIDVEHHPDDQ